MESGQFAGARENGDLLYLIHRVEDVTEFVRLRQLGLEQKKLSDELRVKAEHMEAEVLARKKQWEESNRRRLESIGRLAGGVAHDFNNLLGVILGCAQRVENQTNASETMGRLLGQIKQATENAASVDAAIAGVQPAAGPGAAGAGPRFAA